MADTRKRVLVTGGAGFVGIHTVCELLDAGYNPVIIDNCCNVEKLSSEDKPESVRSVDKLYDVDIPFHNVDLRNKDMIREVFKTYNNTIQCVLHFAGLKAVGESCKIPLEYYEVNIGGTVNLLQVMAEYSVFHFVFSSSATVYGQPEYLPIDEKHPAGSCSNPYGKTKYFIEEILRDCGSADSRWRVCILRYFNPVGAHSSGVIGESPRGPPANLMPYIAQVAVGRRSELQVFGVDYPTCDGTGVRDYIHVVDLALGHVAALKRLAAIPPSADSSTGPSAEPPRNVLLYNLGTGNGYSVLQMVAAFEAASGRKVSYRVCGRRAGDVASVYGDVCLAHTELGWKATRSLQEMCADLWNYQRKQMDNL